jgi:hypothetical protein
MEKNGQSESRLDRLERLMTQYSIENHDARADFWRGQRLRLG